MKTDYLKVDEAIRLYLPRLVYAEPLYELVSAQRAHLSPYVPLATSVKSLEDVRLFIKNTQIGNQSKRSLVTFLFYENKLAGSIGFVNINPRHASAEIGYWINKDLEGNGIISRSCQKMINYGFRHLDFHRISMKIIPTNEKSLRIPQRLGFQQEGIEREAFLNEGVFYDLAVFSLLKSEQSAQK